MFESLWIDKPHADQRIAALMGDQHTSRVGQYLSDFHRDGFVVINQAVQTETIDKYRAEFDELVRLGKLNADAGVLKNARDIDLFKPGTKILDVHVHSEFAQQIVFAEPLREFLENLFGEPALAFQTLHFEAGSTQAVHNDTAYVVLSEPKSLTASWVALEDVEEGSGELIYYPGSHRFEDFLYKPYRKHFVSDEDGSEIHHKHLNWLHEKAAERGLSLQTFRPKKGDVLFWHADLAHGGGPISRPGTSRRSLVTHYCPARCTPHYFRYLDVERQVKRKYAKSGYMSSAYYPFEIEKVERKQREADIGSLRQFFTRLLKRRANKNTEDI